MIFSLEFKKRGKISWFFTICVVLITSLMETTNNALWDFVIYGRGTTIILFGYKLAVIGIKLPIIVLITKVINDRVIKLLFKE